MSFSPSLPDSFNTRKPRSIESRLFEL